MRTARLVLRPVACADEEAIFRIHSDPRTYAHRPDLVMGNRRQARELASEWEQDWAQHGLGYYAVSLPDGPVIGFTGVRVAHDPAPEHLNVYYRFSPEHQGRGFAFEAAAAAIDHGRKRRPALPVWAVVAPNNPASIALAEKLGFVRAADFDISPGDQVYVKQSGV